MNALPLLLFALLSNKKTTAAPQAPAPAKDLGPLTAEQFNTPLGVCIIVHFDDGSSLVVNKKAVFGVTVDKMTVAKRFGTEQDARDVYAQVRSHL